jgi:ubiquinone/menaquinone biosynthesis C-methylase UbiE
MTCPICGAGRIAEHHRLARFGVAACVTCGVQFLTPQPSDADLASIYTSQYFFALDGDDHQRQHARLKQASAERTLRLLPTAPSGGRLLDVGCGTGDFLIAAAARTYEVTGIEFSESSAATAAARVHGMIVHGSLEGAALPDASFDVVATSDVIEHVRDPLSFARELRRVLKPSGVAVVSTPSTDSWSARLLGRRWMEYKVEHLFYFNRPSLERALLAAGFEHVAIVPNVKVLSFEYIAAHFERFPVAGITGIVSAMRRFMPRPLRDRPFPVVASGITAIAR